MAESVGIEITSKDRASEAFFKVERAAARMADSVAGAGRAMEGFAEKNKKALGVAAKVGAAFSGIAAAAVLGRTENASFVESGAKLTAGLLSAIPVVGSLGTALGGLSDQISEATKKAQEQADATRDAAHAMIQATVAAERAITGEETFDQTMQRVLGSIKKMDDLEQKSADARKRRHEDAKRIAEEAKQKKAEEENAVLRLMQAEERRAQASINATNLVGEMNEQRLAYFADLAEKEEAITAQAAESQQQLAGIAIQAFGALIEGAIESGKISQELIVDTAERAVMAYAASSAAATAFSQAGIPVIGPLLATTAAGVMFAFVKKYMKEIHAYDGGEVQRFASGGDVRGGLPGRDSVRGLLMPGERVLTVRENHALKTLAGSVIRGRMLGPSFHAAMGGEAMAGRHSPGFGNVTIVAPTEYKTEMTQEQMDRWLIKALRRLPVLAKDRMIKLG